MFSRSSFNVLFARFISLFWVLFLVGYKTYNQWIDLPSLVDIVWVQDLQFLYIPCTIYRCIGEGKSLLIVQSILPGPGQWGYLLLVDGFPILCWWGGCAYANKYVLQLIGSFVHFVSCKKNAWKFEMQLIYPEYTVKQISCQLNLLVYMDYISRNFSSFTWANKTCQIEICQRKLAHVN